MRQQFVLEKVNHSSIVMVVNRVLNETALVIEQSKPMPWYWKCPGGGGEEGETPLETAVSEVKEEIGVVLFPEHLIQIGDQLLLGEHTKYHYLALVDSWEKLKSVGNEGEIVRTFHLSVLNRLNFLPKQWEWWGGHREQLRVHGVILPVRASS